VRQGKSEERLPGTHRWFRRSGIPPPSPAHHFMWRGVGPQDMFQF